MRFGPESVQSPPPIQPASSTELGNPLHKETNAFNFEVLGKSHAIATKGTQQSRLVRSTVGILMVPIPKSLTTITSYCNTSSLRCPLCLSFSSYKSPKNFSEDLFIIFPRDVIDKDFLAIKDLICFRRNNKNTYPAVENAFAIHRVQRRRPSVCAVALRASL